MSRGKRIPIALTVAGSDSGGGAGIQADLKTFASLGVHGTSAITCLTAQNPKAVLGVEASSPEMVRQQLVAVFSQLPPQAVKTGMLYSAGIIRVIAKFFNKTGRPQLIVDPVMISTSGARLLKASALELVKNQLMPLATLVTPNLSEAEILIGAKLESPEDMRRAAREVYQRFGCAALVKGGHLRGSKEAIDIFYDGKNELLLSAPFLKCAKLHGTGCTYSAAITAYLAKGHGLQQAVALGKEYITQAIANCYLAADHSVLNTLPAKRGRSC